MVCLQTAAPLSTLAVKLCIFFFAFNKGFFVALENKCFFFLTFRSYTHARSTKCVKNGAIKRCLADALCWSRRLGSLFLGQTSFCSIFPPQIPFFFRSWTKNGSSPSQQKQARRPFLLVPDFQLRTYESSPQEIILFSVSYARAGHVLHKLRGKSPTETTRQH